VRVVRMVNLDFPPLMPAASHPYATAHRVPPRAVESRALFAAFVSAPPAVTRPLGGQPRQLKAARTTHALPKIDSSSAHRPCRGLLCRPRRVSPRSVSLCARSEAFHCVHVAKLFTVRA
jgi:hypothetical protein